MEKARKSGGRKRSPSNSRPQATEKPASENTNNGGTNEASSRHSARSSKADHGASGFLLEEPPKSFTSSTVGFSSGPQSVSPSSKRFRKISVELSPLIPLNDDSEELTEQMNSEVEQEKTLSKSITRPDEEQEISIVKTMTMEEMHEHVSRCLQLSTENKINTKNAFALKLIDCMTIINKSEEKNNFAVMACQLDAGAKIYSHRVDAVHQQVMKLVETCMYAEKKCKKDGPEGEHDDNHDEDAGTDEKTKDKKRKAKKKVLASAEQISRKPKENDPRDKFVRLEALPGDILNKAKQDPKDLSLTLDRHTPFWMDWEKLATKATGQSEITSILIKNRRLGPKLEMDRDLDLSSIPKLEPLLPQMSCDEDMEIENNDCDDGFAGDICDFDESEKADTSNKTESDATKDDSYKDVEMVSLAKSRMKIEGANSPSRLDVIKALFHRPGESEYHYLKMDNSYYWAGPSYWKRPCGVNLAENKKRTVLRKKKEPKSIEYTEAEAQKSLKPKVSLSGMVSKRNTILSRRTLMKWSSRKVTYPPDILFQPRTFYCVFHVQIEVNVGQNESNQENDLPPTDSNVVGNNDDHDNDVDDVVEPPDHDNGVDDVVEPPDHESESEDVPGDAQGPAHDSNDFDSLPEQFNSALGFRGFPSPSDGADNNTGMPSTSGAAAGLYSLPDAGMSSAASAVGEASGGCDVYEGANLVPMVKTVKVDPIRCVAKPNRVDMRHLKEVMLSIIRRSIEARENQLRREGVNRPRGSVAFRDLLTELFSGDELERRTREDLTVQMAFLALLTLANENSFDLTNDETGEVIISYLTYEAEPFRDNQDSSDD